MRVLCPLLPLALLLACSEPTTSTDQHDTGNESSADQHDTGDDSSADQHDTADDTSAEHYDTIDDTSADQHDTAEDDVDDGSASVEVEPVGRDVVTYLGAWARCSRPGSS